MRIAFLFSTLLFAGSVFGYGMRIDFSGTWVPDPTKSTSAHRFKLPRQSPDLAPRPELPAAEPDAMDAVEKIEQKGANIKVSTMNSKNEVVQTLSLATDGLEKVNKLPSGVIHKSTAYWESTKLIVTWSLEYDGKVFSRGQDTRELSEDEKEQTLTKHIEDSSSVTDLKIVFHRQ